MTDVFEHPDFGHEAVHFHSDPDSGLRTIVAIHDRSLGPAIGGCRLLDYPSGSDALRDVLRLSRGMTYKCAIGGIPFGGGKAVILAPADRKTPALLRAFGRFVDSLGGRYITSFDVGTTLEDVRTIGEATAHVGGIREGAGDAAESTAQGVFECLRAAVAHRWPGRPLADLTVAIQGVGSVGAKLATRLSDAGAGLVVADADPNRAVAVANSTGARILPPDAILSVDADVVAPCALGGILDSATAATLRAGIVVGGANNQLAHPGVADDLRRCGIIYVPDFLANAGGIIDLHYQLNDVPRADLPAHLAGLGETLLAVLAEAAQRDESPASVADRVAERRIAAARARRS